MSIISFVFDKSAVPHRPHDKVFQAHFTESKDKDATAFPAPADIMISNENSFLLPAPPPSQPLLHLELTAAILLRMLLGKAALSREDRALPRY